MVQKEVIFWLQSDEKELQIGWLSTKYYLVMTPIQYGKDADKIWLHT